jgi:hypothetical protein
VPSAAVQAAARRPVAQTPAGGGLPAAMVAQEDAGDAPADTPRYVRGLR